MAMVESKAARYRVWAAHAFLIAFIVVTMFPLLMIVSISFRQGNLAVGSLIPENTTLEHWSLALGLPYERADGTIVPPPFPVMLWLWNSIKVAVMSAALILAMSTTAAFAFARMRFRGKGFTLSTILVLQMFPAVLTLVAIFALFDQIGEYVPWLDINTHGALVLSYAGGIALHIWTIKGYMEQLSSELEEAARVDGASYWQAFRFIFLPLSVPILAVVFVLAFIGTIIEYPVASILLQTEETLTLAVGSRLYLYEQNYLWGDFAAAAVLSGLPITVVFLVAQRWLVSGLTAGAVKG